MVWLWISRAALLLAIGTSVWFGSAPKCATCRVENTWIEYDDGARIRARLYVPAHGAEENLPGVIVCHGYLGTAGFMEVPWAEDLTQLGVAAFIIDRRGHGRSNGAWWPLSDKPQQHLTDLYPDIRSAVSYLRARTPLIDPTRIALVGHSDGGTGAMVVASADWNVAATVSLSASVAPWEYVNYVVPKNLLLLYGRQDLFILQETDVLLIKSATRGHLGDEGNFGDLNDGSARHLARVEDYGHVDILYSEQARRTALNWLAGTFQLQRGVELSPLRSKWAILGTVLLLLLVLFWNGVPPAAESNEGWGACSAKVAVVAALWFVGLAAASWVGPRLRGVPVQEGSTVVALLGAQWLLMSAVAVPRLVRSIRRPSKGLVAEIARGAGVGALAQLGLETTLRPMYTTSVDPQRLVLFLVFLAFAAPAFVAICSAAAWVGKGRGVVTRGLGVEVVLGAMTAALAPQLFVRMSVLPVMIFAVVLVFAGAYRASGHGSAGVAAFGAVMFARAASVVCAFY